MKVLGAISVVLFSICLAACGDDAAERPDARPIVPPADARITPDAPPGPVVCTATDDYGDVGALGPMAQVAQYAADNMGMVDMTTILFSAALNGDPLQDQLSIQLYEGFTAWAGQPGTFQITGAELDFATCGVCVRIFSDVEMGGASDMMYMATGGTVTITAVTPNIVGTLTNITFEHVTGGVMSSMPPFHTTPAGDGCESNITNLAFDTPVNQP